MRVGNANVVELTTFLLIVKTKRTAANIQGGIHIEVIFEDLNAFQ